MIRFFPIAGALALVLATHAPVAAATQQNIAYTYYSVSGRTPAEIYRSILNRGPVVAGEKAIAATAAQGLQKYSMAEDGASCRVIKHELDFRFTVQLPRPSGLSSMRPQDRQLWQQFSVFLKAHELQHTRLWLGCAAELERSVMAIRSASCKDTARKAESLWRTMKASCDKLQGSFDREQRGELLAQPFMQRVMRGD